MDTKFNWHIETRFQSLIWQLLDNEQYKSALFWSEKYFCHNKNHHPARHLYALSLLRNGQTQSALHHVNLLPHQRCRECLEIYAKCCNRLGRYSHAKEALESIVRGEGTTRGAPNTTFCLAPALREKAVLLARAGSAALRGNQPERAIANFKEALQIEPYIWEAFEGLCALGSFPSVDELFAARYPGVEALLDESGKASTSGSKTDAIPTASGLGFFTPDVPQTSNQGRRLGQKSQNLQQNADSSAILDMSLFGENSMIAQQMHARLMSASGLGMGGLAMAPNSRSYTSTDEAGPVAKKARSTAPASSRVSLNDNGKQANTRGAPHKARLALHSTNLISSARPQPPSRTGKGETTSSSTRRSTRLLSNGSSTGKEQSRLQKYTSRVRKGLPKTRTRSQASEDEDMLSVDSALSPSASPLLSPLTDGSPGPSTVMGPPPDKDVIEWRAADNYIMLLLRRHASAYQKMAQYDCLGVIKEIETLSPEMQRSPSALSLVGRAYYEMVDYQKAEGAFKEVRKLDPYRLYDMELYSTLLWHLQKSVRLSFLAQEMVSIDEQSPQAWIAVGNCFSLQKERPKAMACFQKAAQLDPTCAYAYTLSGHESVDDELEKAIGFFQAALRVDPRHYNAWYGLGTCYLRLSKLRQAEYHYRRATELHPTNAVLLGCLGMAVERRGLREEAFNLYKEAVRLSPDNALVRYRRAKILISLQRYQEALDDLLHLRDIAPDESNVVYQLAKLYRLMGNTVQAALQLATARDLSPQSMSKIKKLVETTRDGEGGEMEE